MGDLYDRDYYEWTQQQAAALRRLTDQREVAELDLAHLAEELEALGNRDLLSLESEIALVIEHLLKLEHSPADPPCRNWRLSVIAHRNEAEAILEQSPSLRGRLSARMAAVFRRARRAAVESLAEDDVGGRDIPASCPYTLEQTLDHDWWPASLR